MSLSQDFDPLGASPPLLWQAVQSQLSSWVSGWTEERRLRLTTILDSELWTPAVVPPLFQAIADQLQQHGRLRDSAPLPADAPDGRAELRLYGEDFVVVGTALILLESLGQYASTAAVLPSLVPELLLRLVELLKCFNSRTCQLILGAGAMHTIGIRSITVKHIALAWRSLALVVRLIPVVQEELEALLPVAQAQLKRHSRQVLKDYEDHIGELYNKLVFISESAFSARLARWRWSPDDAATPSSHLAKIVRNQASLHEQLSAVLPPTDVSRLPLSSCFTAYPQDSTEERMTEFVGPKGDAEGAHALQGSAPRAFAGSTNQSRQRTFLRVRLGPSSDWTMWLFVSSFVCSEWSYYMENLRQLPSCSAVDDTLTQVYSGK